VKIDENCSTPIYSRNQQNDCAADEEAGVAIADGQKTTLSQSGIATYGHHGGFGVKIVWRLMLVEWRGWPMTRLAGLLYVNVK
jgi:hypothetical protein